MDAVVTKKARNKMQTKLYEKKVFTKREGIYV